MLLQAKIALIVTLVVLTYAAVDHAAQRVVIAPRFTALERREASRDVERVERALSAEIENVDSRCKVLASWDESLAFVERSRPTANAQNAAEIERFIAANLGLSSFESRGLNLLYFVDRDGTVLWGNVRDLASGAELKLKELSFERLSPSHPMLVKQDTRAGIEPALPAPITGLMMTGLGPMFVSSRPIVDSRGGGPFAGTLIMGRLLNDAVVERIARFTEVKFRVWPLEGATLPEAERAVLDEVTASAKPVVHERDGGDLAAYTTLADMRRIPALLVRADVPRDISGEGSTALRYSMVSTISAGVLLLLVLLFVLGRTVIAPLARLTRLAVEIGRTEDYSARLGLERRDELGMLSREFDSMLGKLELSRAAVVKAARAAGMSEIATGVLHDVGNALNSVNVSLGQVTRRIDDSKVEKFEKVVELVTAQGESVGQFVSSDPKGKRVVPYLGNLARMMRVDQDEISREVRSLGDGIEHISKLLASQQELAGKSELREPTRIHEPIDQALLLALGSPERSEMPATRVELEDPGRVLLDKHKLVQILVNLLKNASESIAQAGRGTGRIAVRGCVLDGLRYRIEVSDDGVGIAAADLERIFQHGVTTKPGGHGFGLHSSANAARELHGDLSVHSDGPGRGATFILELPFEAAPHA